MVTQSHVDALLSALRVTGSRLDAVLAAIDDALADLPDLDEYVCLQDCRARAGIMLITLHDLTRAVRTTWPRKRRKP